MEHIRNYREHERHPQEGWRLVRESKRLSDFHENAWWAFEAIATHGHEYIKVGDTMWDIEYALDLSRNAYDRWLDATFDEVDCCGWHNPPSLALPLLEPSAYEYGYENWVQAKGNPDLKNLFWERAEA